jgi:hypothetical protein
LDPKERKKREMGKDEFYSAIRCFFLLSPITGRGLEVRGRE